MSENIKRMTAPATVNGRQWEVQLSAAPSREWLEFFRRAGGPSVAPAESPQRVTFDRASAVFRTDAEHVEQWIEWIDGWIGWADARHRQSVEAADIARSARLDAEAKERDRIVELNERFKHL